MSKKKSLAQACGVLVAFSTLMATAPAASARVYVNSTCHMKTGDSQPSIIGDENVDEKYPLASISKVVTTHWAVARLGAKFRFTTKLHLNKVDDETYDLHIEGNRDPIMGRNAAYFIISELNKSEYKVRKIRNLTFDQNFLIDWLAEEKPRIGGNTPYFRNLQEQTNHVRRTLEDGMITSVMEDRYSSLKRKAQNNGIEMVSKPSLKAENVAYLSSADFVKKARPEATLVYKSAPLFEILKRMNNQSNNYIADHLFWNLGGTEMFNDFIVETMRMDTSDLEFYLGSGNNAGYIYDANKNIYNEGTCEAMIRVLYLLDKNLAKEDLRLQDVMAVAAEDSDSTVRGYGGAFARSTIAKTGSVNKAKTLAGKVKTKEGSFYFTILVNTSGRSEWGAANTLIKNTLSKLIQRYGGSSKQKYEEFIPLPFDKESSLVKEVLPIQNYSLGQVEFTPTGDVIP